MRWIGLLILCVCAGQLCGQTAGLPEAPDAGVRRFEVGGQLTDVQLGHCYDEPYGCFPSVPQFAVGPGITLNLNTHLAVDASYAVFTGYDTAEDLSAGGRGTEFLVGVRAEGRARRYGLFAYARPGFVHWSGVVTGLVAEPVSGIVPGNVLVTRSPETYFAMQVGGGVEVTPPGRVRLRLEMADLVLDRGQHVCGGCAAWANNLQTSAGVYVGVGRGIYARPRLVESRPPHRFFDATNLLLIGVSLLGQSVDDISTQRFHAHGREEQDPFARPLVDQGWGGQIGLAVIVNAAQISAMYGLHRMGYHKIERALPLGMAGAGALSGYSNLKNE